MAHDVRRLEVGEVGDGLESVLELLLGDDGLERRLGSQHGVPAGRSIEVAEEHRRLVAEDVHQRGIELGAGSFPRHRDGGVDAIGAVVDLDHVGQRHEARREQDLVLLQAERRVLAVPSLEGLLERPAHLVAEAEARSQGIGGQPVVLEHHHGVAHAASEKADTRSHPLQQGSAGPDGVHHLRKARAIDEPGVVLEGDVVAEPLGLLVGVDVTPHPRQQPAVVDDTPLGLVQAQPFGESQGDQALPDDVLHGLSQPQVGAQRQRCDQFGQAHVVPFRGH